MTEAAVSGLLAVTLERSTQELSPDRFLDALVGSGVALGVRPFFPSDLRQSVERAAHPIFEELAAVLRETAAALSAGDIERAERALYRTREIDARVGGLKEALAAGYQTARLSPSRRRALGQLGLYATAAEGLDLAEPRGAALLQGAGFTETCRRTDQAFGHEFRIVEMTLLVEVSE